MAVEHGLHVLPAQGPIAVFVHHNTLHAFEHLPFDEAVVAGVKKYGAHPYWPESRYRNKVEWGRISVSDLEKELLHDLGEAAHESVAPETTRLQLRLAMMARRLRLGPDEEIRWSLAETDAMAKFLPDVSVAAANQMVHEVRHWMLREYTSTENVSNESLALLLLDLSEDFEFDRRASWTDETWTNFTLRLLYSVCRKGASQWSRHDEDGAVPIRQRELLLDILHVDCDEPVHDFLIRFLSNALDQGISQWQGNFGRPGLFGLFLDLYGSSSDFVLDRLAPLRDIVRREEHRARTARESIAISLRALGVKDETLDAYIESTLLALPGWTSMVWQLESNAEWTPRPLPKGSLEEMLAIRLLLDRASIAYALRRDAPKLWIESLGSDVSFPALQVLASKHQREDRPSSTQQQRAFLLFQIAQRLGWNALELAVLSGAEWKKIVKEVLQFGSLNRRRIYHSAFERHYREELLDAVSEITKLSVGMSQRSPFSFQVITCIDDREESLRRHLEEIDAGIETFGAAGFFGVPMYFRSVSDAHYIPLCPVVIKPKHFVDEVAHVTYQEMQRRQTEARRVLGKASHQIHLGSRSLLAGTLTSFAGSIASIPMVARVLAPRFTAKAKELLGDVVKGRKATTLCLERIPAEGGGDESSSVHHGFTDVEMADVVERLLGDIGLQTFSPLVVVLGHGSSSLNNPHESAYNCGACGGGRGGPNARALAQMANEPRVRRILQGRGVSIPEETWFVGGYHNTCNDHVEFSDLDRVPPTHQRPLWEIQEKLRQACERNAWERCRRFTNVKPDISPHEALRYVEERSEDLAQARPEYNHATNAACVVGRRSRTRGLFMDRRSFLTSYDPTLDNSEHDVLHRLLSAVIPVCAGISLEYLFSTIDNSVYGCGSKLPHNIAGLIGVMEGAASDLRCGLSQQMVEIHEPMRIVFVIEATEAAFRSVMHRNESIGRLVTNNWIQVALLSPTSSELLLYQQGRFEPYRPTGRPLPTASSSGSWFHGWRGNLGFSRVEYPIAMEPRGGNALGPGAMG
ncbi:hypothetical protein VN12_26945 [Pirellula sp. SH-Sr6A]|nr:hypothetical protein VN12_26945 [Pirellula sp. SH-Sr6A]